MLPVEGRESIYQVRRSGKVGLVYKNAVEFLPPIYDSLVILGTRKIKYKYDGKWGLKSVDLFGGELNTMPIFDPRHNTNTTNLPPIYDIIELIGEGVGTFTILAREGKYGVKFPKPTGSFTGFVLDTVSWTSATDISYQRGNEKGKVIYSPYVNGYILSANPATIPTKAEVIGALNKDYEVFKGEEKELFAPRTGLRRKRDGKVVIPPTNGNISPVYLPNEVVYLISNNSKYSIWRPTTGQRSLPIDGFLVLGGGMSLMKDNIATAGPIVFGRTDEDGKVKFGIVDWDGKILVPAIHIDLQLSGNNRLAVFETADHQFWAYDIIARKMVIPKDKYDKIETEVQRPYLKVYRDDKVGLIDEDARSLLDIDYLNVLIGKTIFGYRQPNGYYDPTDWTVLDYYASPVPNFMEFAYPQFAPRDHLVLDKGVNSSYGQLVSVRDTVSQLNGLYNRYSEKLVVVPIYQSITLMPPFQDRFIARAAGSDSVRIYTVSGEALTPPFRSIQRVKTQMYHTEWLDTHLIYQAVNKEEQSYQITYYNYDGRPLSIAFDNVEMRPFVQPEYSQYLIKKHNNKWGLIKLGRMEAPQGGFEEVKAPIGHVFDVRDETDWKKAIIENDEFVIQE